MKISKDGGFSGKVGSVILYSSKYGKLGRNLAKAYYKKNTAEWAHTKSLMAVFAAIWKSLPEELKSQWELYAKWRGSASEVESAGLCYYPYCPIKVKTWKAKVMNGCAAFVGLNVIAATSDIDVPRLMPPLGEGNPPNPIIRDGGYHRERGILKLQVEAPHLEESFSDLKVVLWVGLAMGRSWLVYCKKFMVIDIPQNQTTQHLELSGLPTSGKPYGYKPINFADLPYAVINIAAQIVIAKRANEAPLVSAPSNVIHRGIVNSPELVALEKQTQDGILGKVKGPRFISHFIKTYMPSLAKQIADIKERSRVKIIER
ncbi:hypothetical protein HY605_04185 [Candidatus Peregrinibacteria bacterium]|nr:hypothetical protein [Candidatus Peregrinibacteria bacterium]